MNANTPPEYLAGPDEPMAPVPAMPWSSEAEQGVLGALLLDNAAFDRVADVVQEGQFWFAAHRTIWAAIAKLIVTSKPADILTVHDVLRASKQADDCGRYCLNDLHRASGGNPNHRPQQFMRNKQARALLKEMGGAQICASVIHGDGGGTYVAKEMVYAYAMWISPACGPCGSLAAGQPQGQGLHPARAAPGPLGRRVATGRPLGAPPAVLTFAE